MFIEILSSLSSFRVSTDHFAFLDTYLIYTASSWNLHIATEMLKGFHIRSPKSKNSSFYEKELLHSETLAQQHKKVNN